MSEGSLPGSADLRRVRADLVGTLRQLDQLGHIQNGCADANLRRVLGNIQQRKARQATRLMRWLGGPGPAASDPVQSITAAPDLPAQDLAALSQPTASQPTSSQPASAAEGVPVLERIDVTPELIRLKVPRPLDFNFRPGQSVKVGLDGIRRSYSLVSAPHEPVLEFFIELVAGGQMSDRLRRLKPGDHLSLGAPKGGLRFDPAYPHHLMIATVTGINPFLSILRDYLKQGHRGHRFHLLHGASYQTEFGYREELAAMAASHPDLLTYLPTVSRPDEPANASWSGSRGRVDSIVDAYLRQAGLTSKTTRLYACGHSGMLDAVTGRYRPQGFQIVTESYD